MDMSDQKLAINIVEFQKRYDKQVAVSSLTLKVARGTFFGFVGPNGAGKSTTINAMVGLIRPSKGLIEINGWNVEQNPLEAKGSIGFMPEEVILYERLTSREYLNFIGRMYGMAESKIIDRSKELLDMLDLEPDKLMGAYSMGMKKKAAIAAALIHDPPVIILDEPFSGIDATTGSRIRKVLNEMVGAGHTVFFSSHVLETVERISSVIGIINKGQLLSAGSLNDILTLAGCDGSASLEDAFLKLVSTAEPSEEPSV
jgi:ABC-2 type transport system ATP-binding protein